MEYVGQINKLRTLKRNSGQKFAWNNWKSLPGMARCLFMWRSEREKEWFLFTNDKEIVVPLHCVRPFSKREIGEGRL